MEALDTEALETVLVNHRMTGRIVSTFLAPERRKASCSAHPNPAPDNFEKCPTDLITGGYMQIMFPCSLLTTSEDRHHDVRLCLSFGELGMKEWILIVVAI